jgi:thiaminase
MFEAAKSKYLLKPAERVAHQRIETSFDITQPFALMQQGLPAAYEYFDFVYVLDELGNMARLATLGTKNFR